MAEGVSITVNIADKDYPIKVDASEHERILEIEQEIKKKLNQLKANYGVKDKQDLLAMFLLQNMIEQKNVADNRSGDLSASEDKDGLFEKLKDLESFVSTYLNS